MATIIDGKAIAAGLLAKVARAAEDFRARHGIQPGLAVVLVGEDPASQVYVRNKVARAAEAGLRSLERRLPANTSQEQLNRVIDELNDDPAVHGILVQLPLPDHLDDSEVIARIDPAKDVDGFHPTNVGALTLGLETLVPCTPQGCLILLRETLGDLAGKHAVVVGRSNIVGKPVAALLLRDDCSVTVVHSRSRDAAALCRRADIVVAAVGRAGMIDAGWIKPGAAVVDVGINVRPGDGKRKLCGDVDFAAVEPVAAAITPVPGGVGPMTIACLMNNTLIAASRQLDDRPQEG